MAQSYEELAVWQRAMELTAAVYRLTQGFPREELFGITSQIRRAVVSISCNIAEGQGRNSTGEFRQFLGVARGSDGEVHTLLQIARTLNFGNPALLDEATALSIEVRKMLFGLIESLANSRRL